MKKKVAKGLNIENPRTLKLYFSPKIRKKGNPDCPAVSSNNYYSSNISKYTDQHLQTIVKEISLHVRDTKFIEKLNQVEEIPHGNLIGTLDVKSLYTNIPNNNRIKAVKWFILSTHIKPFPQSSHNFSKFEFNHE